MNQNQNNLNPSKILTNRIFNKKIKKKMKNKSSLLTYKQELNQTLLTKNLKKIKNNQMKKLKDIYLIKRKESHFNI